MKVLLLGANGQVGSECRKLIPADSREVLAFTRQQADFSDPDAVFAAVIAAQPDLVVNACAYTAVDKAESESEIAHSVNAESVGAMSRACHELKIPCIHISTDYVFDGTAKTPYCEADTVSPTGVYGASKRAGEAQLLQCNPHSIILRTSWVFGLHGNNFVKTMLRLGAERDHLGVVADQFGCPTAALDLANVIVELIVKCEQGENIEWGVYHCSNQGACSWSEFAVAIFDCAIETGLLNQRPKVAPISTAQYPTPAARPAYSVLNCEKLEQLLGRPMPHWHSALKGLCLALK